MVGSERLLATLAAGDLVVEAAPPLPPVSGLTDDSRAIQDGMAFVAVRGSQQDGHRFAAAALERGAALLVVERRLDLNAPQLVVRDGRRAAVVLAKAWYGDPATRLHFAGVTGTSGKTTTTALVRHLLNERGTVASIGTLGAFDGAGASVPSTAGALTTPGPIDLQATLATLVARGTEWVAMETSSHSLEQGRLDALEFRGTIFTNLSREHLDYHETMDHYRAAKLRLLDAMAVDGVAAVNRDDPAWSVIDGAAGILGFGFAAAADVRATGVVHEARGSRFRIEGRFGSAEVRLPLPGDFNVYNALGAATLALALGRPLDEVVPRLATAPQVPGRMERLAETPFVVVRDYAHKPDALERVLRSLRPLTPGRLVVLFGCGGDRDRGKRSMMGRIAAELGDLSVITSDNPRTEDPARILDDILAEWPSDAPFERILERREAIAWTLARAKPGDTVVLAGKGHETYQIIGHDYLPFDEAEIVRTELGGSR